MKSKKMLAQIAAFSLVFGMTGVVLSWADDIVLDGTTVKFPNDAIRLVKNEDGSFTVSNQKVKGVWLQNGSKLTANNVDFIINGGHRFSEISVDDKSILTVNGGSLDSGQDAFNVNDGSKAEVNEAKVTTGAWANNAAITLKNSTTSGNWLYAGNAFPEDEKDKDNKVAEGLPVGSITIDGGMASVKNVLVQNKGQFNVTNGAVLDVTKDTSATDSAWEQPATGIMKGGEIVVRAWGPNTAQAEKENSDTINKLDKETIFSVDGNSTVKADVIEVAGDSYDKTVNQVRLLADGNSTIETNTLHFDAYGYGKFKDSQLNVKDKLLLDDMTDLHMEGGSASLNEVSLSGESQINFKGTNAAMKSVSLNNAAVLEAWDNTFQADRVNLSNEGIIEFYNGSKANVGQLTADHGVVYLFADKSQGDGTPDVTIAKMDLKNKSEINLCAGTLHSDQITMDDSTIDIAGVGTLIANKMTLNNTTLSLSSIQNEVTTLALDADEDIQPLDVTQYGVTVEVKDTLDMNGGTLKVNDGSKLITNQMKLANGSMVTVDGTNSSYTIKGTDNTVSGDAKIDVINGGSVTLAEGAGIKAEAGTDNKVKTIITADAGSTVDVTKGSLYIANAKKDGTVYDVSTAVKSGTENKGNDFDKIYGDSRRTKAVEKDANGNYTFKSNIDEISKDSPISNILKEADENEGKLTDFVDKAFGEGTTDAQANNALEHAAAIAEMAGVTHGTYGFAQDFSGMIADHKGEGSGIWANYLRQDKKVDGFQVAGRKAKYDVKYNGFLIGSDLISDENSRTGIAFAYADGSHTEKDGVTGKNDTKYYGGDVYHHFTAGGIQYKADIGFIKSENDLEQTQLGTTIKGSVDGNAFFAGIRAEKEIALGASSLTPYAGLRYYRIHTGDFTDSLGMKHETENANLWNLPVGVEFRHEVKNGNWSLTPVAEIGYNFAMGDKDTKETVSLGGAADTFSFDIGESAFLARLGVEAENSTWTLGGGYRYQKGSDTQSNQWYIQAGYRF